MPTAYVTPEPGAFVVIPAQEPTTLGELAAQAVDRARSDLERAQVALQGALERQKLIADYGKTDQPLHKST